MRRSFWRRVFKSPLFWWQSRGRWLWLKTALKCQLTLCSADWWLAYFRLFSHPLFPLRSQCHHKHHRLSFTWRPTAFSLWLIVLKTLNYIIFRIIIIFCYLIYIYTCIIFSCFFPVPATKAGFLWGQTAHFYLTPAVIFFPFLFYSQSNVCKFHLMVNRPLKRVLYQRIVPFITTFEPKLLQL